MGMPATIPLYTVADLDRFPEDGNRYELLDGVLLVTPAPGAMHQLLAVRLIALLQVAVGAARHAFVFGPGAVSFPPRTQLEPDVLVAPYSANLSDNWQDLTGHWLAVEVISRSSRIYDREFKRDAYLALGVHEVWLVDRWDLSVDVARAGVAIETVRDALVWRPPVRGVEVRIELGDLFAGLAEY